jgi:hypothetical protein
VLPGIFHKLKGILQIVDRSPAPPLLPVYLHFFAVGPVNKPVFVVNTARPVAGQIAFQGFGLSYPGEWVALDPGD